MERLMQNILDLIQNPLAYVEGIYNVLTRIHTLLKKVLSFIEQKDDKVITIHLNSHEGIHRSDTRHSRVLFQFNKPIAIPKGAQMALRSYAIPRSYYIIDETNDSFRLTIDSTDYDITLRTGNFNAFEVANEIQLEVNALTGSSPELTVTYGKQLNKFTWTFADTTSAISLTTNVENSAYRVIAEDPESTVDFELKGIDMVHLSTNAVNVQQKTLTKIKINNFAFSDVINNGSVGQNILHTIYFSKNYNAWEAGTENVDNWKNIVTSNSYLQDLEISMIDEDDKDMLFNGVNYYLTILVRIL